MKDKPFFEASDFGHHSGRLMTADDAQKLANAKLEKALGPEVYSNYESEHLPDWKMGILQKPRKTHQAILFNIQPIEKPKCDHIPGAKIFSSSDCEGRIEVIAESFSPICAKCGVKLQATWQEKGE